MGGPKLTYTSPDPDSSTSDTTAKSICGLSRLDHTLPSKCSHSSLGQRVSRDKLQEQTRTGLAKTGHLCPGAPGSRLSFHKPCLYRSIQAPIHLCFLREAIWQTDSGRGQEGSDSGPLCAGAWHYVLSSFLVSMQKGPDVALRVKSPN